MNRRQALAFITPLSAGAFGLAACTERRLSHESVNVPPYDELNFHAKLEAMRRAYERKAPTSVKNLQAGLGEEEIRRKTAWFPGALPEEIIGLYKWRNGYLGPAANKEPPFWFYDYVFTPIEKTESDYGRMMTTYGAQPHSHEMLRFSFPFASLGGGWLVLPTEQRAFDPRFPRAIISVYQRITVFFYSATLMAETCTAWMEHPKNNGFGLPSDEEMRIWRQFNPGLQ